MQQNAKLYTVENALSWTADVRRNTVLPTTLMETLSWPRKNSLKLQSACDRDASQGDKEWDQCAIQGSLSIKFVNVM